jgi:hypothetical protein
MRDALWQILADIDGVVEGESAFREGPAYWANGTEIVHLDGPDRLDIRLTRTGIRQRRDQLRADPRVQLRSSASDWLTVQYHTAADEQFILDLVHAAAAAHQPPAGTTPAPPPTGTDLARRRRFH